LLSLHGGLVRKDDLIYKMREFGDVIITYRSQNSNKLKYNVCTIEFDNAYIKSKNNKTKEQDDTLLTFCWDTDTYKLIKPASVTSVVPLSSALGNHTHEY
jgi:hypothetical protein